MDNIKASFTERDKFENRRKLHNEYIEWLKKEEIAVDEFLFNSAAFIGDMQLNRIFTIYELFKKTIGLAGHIAEVGVFKGAGSLLLAKLVKLFEPESYTQVHGFDAFFKIPESPENRLFSSIDDYQRILQLKRLQNVDGILNIHKLNIIEELEQFFAKSPQLKFKFVFMDIGSYEVMKSAIPFFYEHLLPQGIMVFDHYSLQLAPGETVALSEILPDAIIRTIPNSWTPNAYIIKD